MNIKDTVVDHDEPKAVIKTIEVAENVHKAISF